MSHGGRGRSSTGALKNTAVIRSRPTENSTRRCFSFITRGAAAGVFRAGVDPMQLYITIIALGHFYVANRHTLSTIFDAPLDTEGAIAAREAHIAEVVLGYLRP